MPTIVRILEEDIKRWELYEHGVYRDEEYLQGQEKSGHFHYRPLQIIYDSRLDSIKVISPQRLEALVGHDLICFVNREKHHLSKKFQQTELRRTTLLLKRLNRKIEGSCRRLRLKIKTVEFSGGKTIVLLDEYKESELQERQGKAR